MTAPRHQLADDRLLSTEEALAYLAERVMMAEAEVARLRKALDGD